MKDGPKRVLSHPMEQPWKASEATLTVVDAAPASSTLLSSPKAPLRSMSHGNFRATSTSSMSVGSPALSKRTISVVEEMESKQRENMNRKLKDLQLIAGSRSPQPKFEMPTIDSRLAKTSALTRSTLRRDSVANYQAVTPAALSLKGASPATPRFSLSGPELFPLRASHSLTSLNRVYDRGLSVFVSDDYDSYSTAGKGLTENHRLATGNALPRTSLSSSVRVEYVADVPLAREVKPTEEKVVENAVDNIFKAISLTGDNAQYKSDYKQRSKQDGSLTSGVSSTAAGPPLNLKTYPKPQVPTKPANLKAFTSKEEKVKILNGGNADVNDYNQILGDFNHSSVEVAKDTSLSLDQQLLEPQEKIGHLARNYNTADLYRRNQEDNVNRPDTRSVLQPSKASFNSRLVIPYTSDPEVSDLTTSVTSSQLGVVSGSRTSLIQSTNATHSFISHQKMDSLLSDCNTVDSGLGRSEAAESPGSHYQDSADELDSKVYTGWTAPTTEFSNEGRDNYKQPPRSLRKKEFVSTAVIRLSPPVMEKSKVNYVDIKPTVKDHKIVSSRQSYLQETPLSASSHRGTSQETSDHVQATQRLTSVPSRYSHSTTPSYLSSTAPNQPTSEYIISDSKVPTVEAETSRPTRVFGKKNHREEGVSVPSNDVIQSNQKSHSEHRKKTASNFETNSSESSYASASRYARSHRESDANEVKRRQEDQSLQRDLHESETRARDEPQRSTIRNKLFEDYAADGRKETRTEVSQSSASNRKNQEQQFFNDALRTRTRNVVRENPEVRNESKLLRDQRRAEIRSDVSQTHEEKNELYVSRDPQFVERTQIRQIHTNSVGFEPRHPSTDTKKDEETAAVIEVDDDDGMVEIEVQLIKALTGLGFCIEGGIDSPLGDKPITVKRLFKGESAAKGKLQPGDIIVAINGKPMSNKSHYQAWNQLKSLPEGLINLAIRRRRPLPAGTLV